MSHFIGLVFVPEAYANLEMQLEPYCEEPVSDEYCEWEDHTEEVIAEYEALPDKAEPNPEHPDWPVEDKQTYPTLKDYATRYHGYEYRSDTEIGWNSPMNPKWDWWCEGGRWPGYLYGKDGGEHDALPFDEVDWEKMYTPVEKEYEDIFDNHKKKTYMDTHIPFCLVDLDGEWYEKGEMGWFGCSYGDKPEDEWQTEVKEYVKKISEMPDEDRESIMVYAVDFHI